MGTSGALGFLGTHPHTSADILGKLLGIVGCNTLDNSFQNDTLRGVWDSFGNIIDFDAVFL